MTVYRTKEGDVLDAVCWKYYGKTSGAVEEVLMANRELEQQDVILKAGIEILLPEIDTRQEEESVRLWS